MNTGQQFIFAGLLAGLLAVYPSWNAVFEISMARSIRVGWTAALFIWTIGGFVLAEKTNSNNNNNEL